jgi:UDP-2,3-diacylglucosamine pyrophosphatase LpxH
MPNDDGRDFVIVSDLHLCGGYDERTGAFSRREDFFYDDAFARFLAYLRARAESEGRRWRLVILGDFFDFLQVDQFEPAGGEPAVDTSAGATMAKLARIARGHRELFAALGAFAAAGFPVDIVPGNHDVELVRPSVQRRLVDLICGACRQPEAAASIHFHPWIYYVPGVLYAEHGHQYDDVNSFQFQLRPFADDDQSQIDLPLGSYFVAYLFNRIESLDPFADNVRPVTSYLVWALQAHPVQTLSTLGIHLRLLVAVLRRSKDQSPLDLRVRREAYRRDVLPAYAQEVGLDYADVVAIDRLAASPAMMNKFHQLRAMIIGPLLEVAPAAAGVVAIYLGLGRIRPGARSFAIYALGLAGLVWRERQVWRSPTSQPSGYLHRAARRIRRILIRAGKSVPVYVFGHTHAPEQVALTNERRPPYYMNTGTWTPTVPASFELLGARETFSFVQITRERGTNRPVARLMAWNDNAGRAEPLPLMSP